MNIYEVIKNPIVSEKSHLLAERGKYIFRVASEATKKEIARAVERLYKGTKVSDVGTLKIAGKRVFWRRRGRRPQEGKRSAIKKAIVTLSEGEIKVFEKGKEK